MENMFKSNLKNLANKYTQRVIAEKTGFSQASINNYLTKDSEPSIQFLIAIKNAFGISTDDFLFSNCEEIVKEDKSKFVGNYIVYYYNNSSYKGEIHTNMKNTLNYGVISVIRKNEIDKDVFVYGVFFKDRPGAISLLKECDKCTTLEEYKNLYYNNFNHYEGDISFNQNNVFISLSNKMKDDKVNFIFNNPPSSAFYIGGLGTVNSVSRGREHNPCIQFAIISRKLIDRPDGEIYNSLCLDYADVNFNTPTSELILLFKRLYVEKSELSMNLSNEQKESIVENKLKYYFNEIAEANMFRFAKISNQEDDIVYRMLKDSSNE